jgi:hypothetical protein
MASAHRKGLESREWILTNVTKYGTIDGMACSRKEYEVKMSREERRSIRVPSLLILEVEFDWRWYPYFVQCKARRRRKLKAKVREVEC